MLYLDEHKNKTIVKTVLYMPNCILPSSERYARREVVLVLAPSWRSSYEIRHLLWSRAHIKFVEKRNTVVTFCQDINVIFAIKQILPFSKAQISALANINIFWNVLLWNMLLSYFCLIYNTGSLLLLFCEEKENFIN